MGFHTRINYPKSAGGLDPQDTRSGALNAWLCPDGGTGMCSACGTPQPWLLAPPQAPAGKHRGLVDAFTRHLVRRLLCRDSVFQQGWSFSRQGRSPMSQALWWFTSGRLSQASLTFWDTLPSPCLSADLLWSVHSVPLLSPGSNN